MRAKGSLADLTPDPRPLTPEERRERIDRDDRAAWRQAGEPARFRGRGRGVAGQAGWPSLGAAEQPAGFRSGDDRDRGAEPADWLYGRGGVPGRRRGDAPSRRSSVDDPGHAGRLARDGGRAETGPGGGAAGGGRHAAGRPPPPRAAWIRTATRSIPGL